MSAIAAIVFGIWIPTAAAQWTITYQFDDQQVTAVLGERGATMRTAANRAKTKLESILTASTGSAIVTIDWSAPANPTAIGSTTVSHFHFATVASAKAKLINKAEADNEPANEIAMYQALPATAIPFFFETSTQLNASNVVITNALNKHLQFQPTTDQNDGTLQFRPSGELTKWQFSPSPKDGVTLEGHFLFEAALIHESMHLLGFDSAGESSVNPPTYLMSWDLFRFQDGSLPINATNFTTQPRELRPTQEATSITAFSSPGQAYKMSRGLRTGGDGYQSNHWRRYTRLTPMDAIGIMDPSTTNEVFGSLSKRLYTRADVEALDIMGWNVNPNTVSYVNAGTINLVAPAPLAQIAQGTSILFEWGEASFQDFSVMIYPGTEIMEDNPVRVFEELPFGTTSVDLSGANALPPGEYVWGVVGSTAAGYISSGERRFTIVAGVTCDSIDFNNDTSVFDPVDIEAFLSVYSEGPCVPSSATCNDVDFNNDGVTFDPCDIASFMLVFGEGPCTQCGK